MHDARRQIALAAAGLALSLGVFQLTDLDLAVQRQLYLADVGRWIWSSHEVITRHLLYDGIKDMIILVALVAGAGLAVSGFTSRLDPHRRALRIVFLSLLLVPALIGTLKATTGIACPRDLVEFGGDASHRGIVEALVWPDHASAQYHCFPAGHASGGFALLSLYAVAETQRRRTAALAVGLVTGWAMGLYKMAIGDHFLSHTIVTMLIAWLVINSITLIDHRLFPRASTANDRQPRSKR